LTPEQEAARAELNRKYPDVEAAGKAMFEAQPQGVGVGGGYRKVGQPNSGIDVATDIALETQKPASHDEEIAQLENGLRAATSAEDRILIQEALVDARERQAQEPTGESTRRRAHEDVSDLQGELQRVNEKMKNAATPKERANWEQAAAALNQELTQRTAVAGSPGAVATASPEPKVVGPLSRGLRPDVALRRAGMQSIYEPGNEDLSVGEFNQKKEARGRKLVADSQVPTTLERVDVSRQKVTTVEVTPEKIQQTLEDPQVAANMERLQEEFWKRFNTPEAAKTTEAKGFLEEAIGEIFGKTGMFDKQDLIRFSVLAAGGLLTGGSVGGSIRYAGLDTIRHSDARRAQERAAAQAQATARAAMQKELRTDLRRMDADSIKALDKKSPQVQAQAIDWMNKAKSFELDGKYEASRDMYRRANMLLTASPDVDDGKTSGIDKYTGQTQGFFRGKPAVHAYTDGGKTSMISQDGKWFPADHNEFESKDDFSKNYEAIVKSTQQQLEPKLRLMYGKGRVQDADVSSKALAHQFAALKHELGRHVSPAEFGQMAEITISGLEPHQLVDGNIAGEALRKSFFLNAVMAMRPKDTDLFRDPKTRKVNADAHAAFVDQLNKVIADNKPGNPNYGVKQASDELIAKWDALPTPVKERYNSAADGAAGMTGFLRWIQAEREKKQP
jgi:hypothetical protein